MSQEIKELLVEYCKWCNAQGGQCQLNLDGCGVGEALTKLRTEQPPAGDFTKRFRDLIELSIEHLSDNKIGRLQTYSFEACARLDRSEASRKALLAACTNIKGFIGNVDHTKGNGENSAKMRGQMLNDIREELQVAIAKEKEVRE